MERGIQEENRHRHAQEQDAEDRGDDIDAVSFVHELLSWVTVTWPAPTRTVKVMSPAPAGPSTVAERPTPSPSLRRPKTSTCPIPARALTVAPTSFGILISSFPAPSSALMPISRFCQSTLVRSTMRVPLSMV